MSCSRRHFLKLVPATLGAGALASLVPGCGGSVVVDGSATIADGEATLTFAQFPRLAQVGNGVIVHAGDGRVIAVVRTGAGEVSAVDAVCTHMACLVRFDAAAGDLECGCHGSVFSPGGAVKVGPARLPLAAYPAVLSADRIVVTLG